MTLLQGWYSLTLALPTNNSLSPSLKIHLTASPKVNSITLNWVTLFFFFFLTEIYHYPFETKLHTQDMHNLASLYMQLSYLIVSIYCLVLLILPFFFFFTIFGSEWETEISFGLLCWLRFMLFLSDKQLFSQIHSQFHKLNTFRGTIVFSFFIRNKFCFSNSILIQYYGKIQELN